jgi:hypothetical protein
MVFIHSILYIYSKYCQHIIVGTFLISIKSASNCHANINAAMHYYKSHTLLLNGLQAMQTEEIAFYSLFIG